MVHFLYEFTSQIVCCTHLFEIDINWWTYIHEMNIIYKRSATRLREKERINRNRTKSNQDISINDRWNFITRAFCLFVHSFVRFAFHFRCDPLSLECIGQMIQMNIFVTKTFHYAVMVDGWKLTKTNTHKIELWDLLHIYVWIRIHTIEIPMKDDRTSMGKSTSETNHTFSKANG